MARKLVVYLPVILALTAVFVPSIWVNLLVLVDFYTPWVLFDSPWYDAYHNFLISRLSEKPETPLPEITASEASYENIVKVSNGFTFPIVVRGLMGNTTAVQRWGDHDWWIQNYGSEELLCGTLAAVVENCTVHAFFDSIKAGTPFYVSGASVIFERHPELHEMIDNPAIQAIEPGKRIASQVFMGLPAMGSDIHSAAGVNIFRMVAGQKKWWFIPPSQTSYLKPAINVNGFSAHTQTLVGKEGGVPSPWLSKLVRYTTVLSPGDVLINPPWFWHGILNLGDASKGDLVIGSPTRYGEGTAAFAAMKSNPLYTINTIVTIARQRGIASMVKGKANEEVNLQASIANNRRDREGKVLESQE